MEPNNRGDADSEEEFGPPIESSGGLDLDLSATAIKEIPPNIPNLPQLRRLILMGFPDQSRFPWHKLLRFPNVFCLDHCAQGHDNHYDDQVACVCVKDSRLFYSFSESTKKLVQQGELLQSFYVQVAASTVNVRRVEDEEDMLANMLRELARKKSPYGDVYGHHTAMKFSAVFMAAPPIRQTARHVQISTIDRYPRGLQYLLEVAKSIYVTNDSFVECLTCLSNLDELEECKLHFCYQMKRVFETTYVVREALARASQLKNLIYFCRHKYIDSTINFSSLNHLHLEYCPRLESIIPRNLTTLDILFCYNISTIFSKDHCKRAISHELPGATTTEAPLRRRRHRLIRTGMEGAPCARVLERGEGMVGEAHLGWRLITRTS
uniref:Uncharacterized protein n=1 Tax=Oryza punctata TaxID=4537 RepID=A0A0E0K3P0_ORYPU